MNNQENFFSKKVANIFPTVLAKYSNFNYEKINEKIIDLLEKEPYGKFSSPFQTLDNHLELRQEYKDLYDWFDIILEDYKKTFEYSCEKFKIILSWANKADQHASHKTHIHPNSFLSGVYYLSENPSPTYFEDPRYQNRTGMHVASSSPIGAEVWPCSAENGSCIIFPSWLPHFTKAQPFEGLRHTISFNAIPTGTLNKGSLVEISL